MRWGRRRRDSAWLWLFVIAAGLMVLGVIWLARDPDPGRRI